MQQSVAIWIVFMLSFCSVDSFIEVIDPLSNVVDWFYDQDIVPSTTTIEGYIETANPSDACRNVTAPAFPPNTTFNKIALINDSDCNFMTKICFAQAAGYDAVVIFRTPDFYNPLLSEVKLRKSGFKACTFNIAVVLINFADANEIKDKYSYDHNFEENNFLIKLIPNTEPWTVKALLSFAVWALPLLAISFICAAIRYLRERYRIWKIKQFMQGRSALGRLKRLFPTVKFSEEDPYESCIICLSHFTIGEKLRVLGCSHAYHPDCIDAWILKHRRRCPMCNRKVLLGDSFDTLDPDPSENTPLLTSSNGSNYSSGLSPISNNISNLDHNRASPNSLLNVGQSAELLPPLQGSVNNAALQNLETANEIPSVNQQGLIV